MVELEAAGCCSRAAQETCCEPEAKEECCGHGDGCDCAEDAAKAMDVREVVHGRVHEREAASAIVHAALPS